MEWLESAAFCVLVPNGCQRDPTDLLGLSNFSCEMLQRGAGSRDSRQFVEALEKLGVERGSSVSNSHTSIAGAMPAKNIDDALGIFANPLTVVDDRQERLALLASANEGDVFRTGVDAVLDKLGHGFQRIGLRERKFRDSKRSLEVATRLFE